MLTPDKLFAALTAAETTAEIKAPAEPQKYGRGGTVTPRPALPSAEAVIPANSTIGDDWLSVPLARPEAASSLPALIEGSFTHDSLPDLFRFLCTRPGRLSWRLVTLAGTFTLLFERQAPVDVMFNPLRPVGAKVGMRALKMLFSQEGGHFQVWGNPPAQDRRTLERSGEQLLIEMATQGDEALAPKVGWTINVDLDLALVQDLPAGHHQTAFRTRSDVVALTEVLQLFSVSTTPYWVRLMDLQGNPVGRLHLSASRQVVSAEYARLTGAAAFSALLGHRSVVMVDVSPLSVQETRRLENMQSSPPLGMLDALLMREVMSGRLAAPDDTGNMAVQEGPVGQPEEEKPSGARGMFGRMLRRD